VIRNGYHSKNRGERGWRETREENTKTVTKKGTKSTFVAQESEELIGKILKYVIEAEKIMKGMQRIYKINIG
jgi:hypothetical protein